MKKLYTIMVVLAGLLCFTGCETDHDDNPILLNPTTFVLNTPAYVSGVYDLRNAGTVLFTTNQPDYGFTASVNYQVQISMENNFQEYEELNTIYTSARIEANASDIAVAMTRLLEDEYDEDNFPEDKLFKVYVRLSATLAGAKRDTIYSNVIELPRVKSYYALPPVELPGNMYLAGNVTGGSDWDWNDAVEMIPVNDTPGKFWRIQYLGQTSDGATAEIKFNMDKSFDEAVGINEVNINTASRERADVSEGSDGNIKIGNQGWYLVVVTVTIEGRDYIYDIEFLEPNVYLTGDTSGGYDVFDESRLFTVPDGLGEFVSPSTIAGGEMRICVKLDDVDWWKTEFMIFNGKIEYRGNGGDQERVNVSAGQKAYLNFTTGTGRIDD